VSFTPFAEEASTWTGPASLAGASRSEPVLGSYTSSWTQIFPLACRAPARHLAAVTTQNRPKGRVLIRPAISCPSAPAPLRSLHPQDARWSLARSSQHRHTQCLLRQPRRANRDLTWSLTSGLSTSGGISSPPASTSRLLPPAERGGHPTLPHYPDGNWGGNGNN